LHQRRLKTKKQRVPCSPDLCHLLAHATHVIVAHLVQLLLILTLDGLALTEDLCSNSNSKPCFRGCNRRTSAASRARHHGKLRGCGVRFSLVPLCCTLLKQSPSSSHHSSAHSSAQLHTC
jgi:hypothetical protein